MDEAMTAKVVPGDTLGTSVVSRNLAANLFRAGHSFSDRIVTEEVGPIRLGVAPSFLGDVGLLDETNAFITPNLAIHDHLETGVHILMDRFEIVLQRAECGRMTDGEIVVGLIGRNIPLLHDVNNRLDVILAHRHVVRDGGSAVGGQRNSGG